MNEHQMRNEINYNTVQIDRYIARSFGLPSWKKLRRVGALESTNGAGPQNPYKTSRRREMRGLLEGLRTFEPSLTHPRGNREARRKATKIAISKDRQESRKRGAKFNAVWDMRLWWHSPHHQIIPRGFLKNLDGTLPEDFRD